MLPAGRLTDAAAKTRRTVLAGVAGARVAKARGRLVTLALALALGCVLSSSLVGRDAASSPPRARIVLPLSAAIRILPPRGWAQRTHGYGWPLRPFDRSHPIRGSFGDPRFGAVERNFHFGIDIAAAGGAPVYAVAPGTVFLEPDHVAVLRAGTRRRESGFSYWHIIPAAREHAFVHRHALLGWVNPLWGHLHFAEIEHGVWVNPLRPGALTPAPDPLEPSIASILVAPTSAGSEIDGGIRGKIGVIVDAYAVGDGALLSAWRGARLSPTLIRWRLLSGGVPLSRWRDAVDFRDFIPPNPLYRDVYAPGTVPNAPDRPGIYLYYLARGWSTARLSPGRYAIEVQATGTDGATATAEAPLTIDRSGESIAPLGPTSRIRG